MKLRYVILAVAFLVPITCFSQNSENISKELQQECAGIGALFKLAADARDARVEKPEAIEQLATRIADGDTAMLDKARTLMNGPVNFAWGNSNLGPWALYAFGANLCVIDNLYGADAALEKIFLDRAQSCQQNFSETREMIGCIKEGASLVITKAEASGLKRRR